MGNPVSFSPDDFTDGGLYGDSPVTVDIVSARFQMYSYGDCGIETPSCVFEMRDVADGQVRKQGWSVGDSQTWYPNPNDGGKTILSYKDGMQFRRNSNFAQLVASLVNAGYPKDRTRSGDVSQFDGMTVVMCRVKAKEIDGVPSSKSVTLADGRVVERERKIMLCEKVVKLPGEKAAGGGKAKGGKAKEVAAAAAPAEVDEGVKAQATEFILGLLADEANAAGIPKKNLLLHAMQKIPADQGRTAIVKLVTQDSFLGSPDAPWSYANGIVKLGE